ncbi:MAG: MOSC N-terminal beta barrel domain-containing protein [Gammaproteobacteria bacterium]
MMNLTEINIFPIKSCGQVSVQRAVVEARGLQEDRRYMLVDVSGRFLTQREHPRMGSIQVSLCDANLKVEALGEPTLEFPVGSRWGRARWATVWHDYMEVSLAADEVNEWFTRAMDFPCQLVYMGEQHHRPLKAGRGKVGDEVSFADGAPLLLISEASLAELNKRLIQPVEMKRFRPNLVTTANGPFAEDEWKRIRIGEVEFDLGWACKRCVLTTIDPETGKKDPAREPLMTLKGFRRGPEGVMFGQNLIPRHLGTLGVGDPIELLQRPVP